MAGTAPCRRSVACVTVATDYLSHKKNEDGAAYMTTTCQPHAASSTEAEARKPLRLGVSACLLGESVRFDGGHKRDRFLSDILGAYAEFVPICPEVEMGLPTPRPAIRLERNADGDSEAEHRLIEPKSRRDLTAEMTAYAESRAATLAEADLDGYILKRDSPSCGLFRVRVYGTGGAPARNGRGLFAKALTEGLPFLPVEEEGRLKDAGLREAFIERLFAYRRLKSLFAQSWTRGDLVAFHAREKLLLHAHDPAGAKRLGRLVADSPESVARAYGEGFLTTLARPASVGRHTDVLQHMAGHLHRHLDGAGRAELKEVIEEYRAGLVPLIVPITLLRHYVRRFAVAYLAQQTYLSPHPKEMMLRNHV